MGILNEVLMEEIWKDVINYEGIYAISNLGNVKSLSRVVYVGHGKKQARKENEKLLRLRCDTKGYQYVFLCKEGTVKRHMVHRLVATHFIDNPYEHPIVNHKDTIKTNNQLTNLEWVTMKENAEHAWRSGCCDNIRKLSEERHKDIVEKYQTTKCTHEDLALEFNISASRIGVIIRKHKKSAKTC